MASSNSLARRTFVVTFVTAVTLIGFVALWKLRILVALLFLAFMLASAMRPGVDVLARRRIPKIVGVLLHYVAFAGLVALVMWFVIPQLLHEVDHALGTIPQTRNDLQQAAKSSTGLKHDVLQGLQKELVKLKTGSLVHPAISLTRTLVEIVVAVFFVLASAAYWIYERQRAEELVISLLPQGKRRIVRDTWDLVELKLGAYVRAQLLMICFVGTVLSFSFWQIGLPYWLLLGVVAGIVEVVPVIGPLAAGVLAVGVGLSVSLEAGVLAAVAVYGLRLVQDYVIGPKVFGGAVGLAPLAVLVAVTAVGLVFGPVYVPLATPFTAVLATLLDVTVRGKEPLGEEVPTVVMPSGDLEDYQHKIEEKEAGRARRNGLWKRLGSALRSPP